MKQLNRIERCKMALQEVREAEKRAAIVMLNHYPVGSDVAWDRGGHTQYGTILVTNNYRAGDRFKVRNDATGKEYWITFYDIQCAAEPRS